MSAACERILGTRAVAFRTTSVKLVKEAAA